MSDASEDDRYATWLASRDVGTETVDLSRRTQVNVRLYLDDVRKCPVGWTVARSVDDAICLMREFTVAEASLDHDLGACSRCIREDPNAAAQLHCPHVPDGQAFVRWMTATGCWPQAKPTVHSMNPVGAAAMRSMIDQHWKAP